MLGLASARTKVAELNHTNCTGTFCQPGFIHTRVEPRVAVNRARAYKQSKLPSELNRSGASDLSLSPPPVAQLYTYLSTTGTRARICSWKANSQDPAAESFSSSADPRALRHAFVQCRDFYELPFSIPCWAFSLWIVDFLAGFFCRGLWLFMRDCFHRSLPSSNSLCNLTLIRSTLRFV